MSPIHQKVAVYLVITILLHVSYGTYNAYVSSSADPYLISFGCDELAPCATFQSVLANIASGYIVDEDIIITISSSIASSISSSYCQGIQIDGNITFNFDSSITTASDWFAGIDECLTDYNVGCGCSNSPCPSCHILSITQNSKVKFNGLIWDKDYHLLDSYENSEFLCENCIFRDITSIGAPLFLLSNTATFYNSIFTNIILSASHIMIGSYPWTSDETNTFITLSHCTVSDVSVGTFISLESKLNYIKSVHIVNTTFANAPVTSSDTRVVTHFIDVSSVLTFSNTRNTVHISSSSFMDTTNHEYDAGLVVLSVGSDAECDISIYDVNISYSQMLETELLDSVNNPDGVVMDIQSRDSIMNINHMVITTQMRCSADNIGTTTRRRRRDLLSTGIAYPAFPYCNSPLPFLLNNGIANISNIELRTDYSASTWASSFNGSLYENGGMYFVRLSYYDDTLEPDNEPYFAAIFNDRDGILNVNNFRVSIGSHFGLVYNRGGTVFINNLYCEYHDDPSAYYDRWSLRLYTGITNNYGTLSITNSVIQGADASLLNIIGGDITITDTILAQSMMAIVTYYTADRIYLNNLNIYEIGTYYASLGAAVYHSISNDPFYSIAPLHVSAQTIDILNSKLYYIASYGLLNVNTYGISNIMDIDIDIDRELNIMNNSFIVTQSMNDAYDGYKYLSSFDYLSSLLIEMYGAGIDITMVATFIDNVNTASSTNAKGLIVIDDLYSLSFGLNDVYISDRAYIAIDSYLYIDSSREHCIASNDFYNIDLYINAGSVASCKHTLLDITNTAQCFEGLGALNDTYSGSGSNFMNSSIIIGDGVQVDVVIDNATFDNDAVIDTIIQVNHSNIRFIVLDAILTQNIDFIFPGYCAINCHEIVGTKSRIRQLIVDCVYNSSLALLPSISVRNNSNFASFTYWSVSAVVLNNAQYVAVFPGGTVPISYAIVDAYNTVIQDYPYNITIEFTNDALALNTYMDITANGECDVCLVGLYIQSISIENVNETYTISSIVSNNELLANDLNIIITECPAGYGIESSAGQCAVCSVGTYSISPNSIPCIECNDAELNGIECSGADIISIDYNYWMDIAADNAIISSVCPTGYCCQLYDIGCDYVTHFNSSLCALHRDPITPLCGQCIDGYSELFGTEICGICDRTYYEYLLLPITICFLFSVYLLCFDKSNPKKQRKQQPTLTKNKTSLQISAKTLVVDDIRALAIMIVKVLMYYSQALAYILTQSSINNGIFYFALPILQFCNLSINFGVGSESDEGYCFIQGMTASQEILLDLLVPASLLTITGAALCTKFCCRDEDILLKKCCCFWRKKRSGKVTHCSAFLRSLLISVGSIVAVMLKLLSCARIDDDTIVHFYYGSHQCYDELWLFAVFMICVIVVVWIVLNVKLCRESSEERQISNNSLSTLVNAYKPEYWYWESVLLSRRMVLALFTIVSDDKGYADIILNILLSIYLGTNIWKQPFKYGRINRLETICILMLIVVLGFANIDVFKSNENSIDKIILGIFMLFCILLPILIVSYEAYRICRHSQTKKVSQETFDKMEQRRPKYDNVEIVESGVPLETQETNTANS